MQVQTYCQMLWFRHGALKNVKIGNFVSMLNERCWQRLLIKLHDSDLWQTLDFEQTKWLRKCHKASRVGVMLLR